METWGSAEHYLGNIDLKDFYSFKVNSEPDKARGPPHRCGRREFQAQAFTAQTNSFRSKRQFVKQAVISHKSNVIVGSYVPGRLKNDQIN